MVRAFRNASAHSLNWAKCQSLGENENIDIRLIDTLENLAPNIVAKMWEMAQDYEYLRDFLTKSGFNI